MIVIETKELGLRECRRLGILLLDEFVIEILKLLQAIVIFQKFLHCAVFIVQ